MGVEGWERDWNEEVRRRESTRSAPVDEDEAGFVEGSSPGRRKPALEPGRDPVPPLERAAASLVNMYRSVPPPPGVLEPLPPPA